MSKHPGPNGSELHSTGTYQSEHGGQRGYHGTDFQSATEIADEGYEIGVERGSGAVWGRALYFTPSFETARDWAERGHGEWAVLEAKLPKMKVLTIYADDGPMRFTGEKLAEWGNPPEVVDLFRSLPLPNEKSWFVSTVTNAGYDAVEILPVTPRRQSFQNEITGGHQLVIYNTDLIDKMKFKVVMRERGSAEESTSPFKTDLSPPWKIGKAQRWFVAVPRKITSKFPLGIDLTKHKGPGDHPSGSPQSVHAPDSAPEADYRGQHQPSGSYGAPAYDLSQLVPADIYDHPEWYPGSEGRPELVRLLRSIRGNPEAPVKVYRAVPRGVATAINPGDWVTPDRSYAIEHGESNLGYSTQEGEWISDYEILETEVLAKDLIWPGDYLPEFGWFPGAELEEIEKLLAKHMGPGRHPSGSEQDVHGRGRGGGVSAPSGPAVPFQTGDNKYADVGPPIGGKSKRERAFGTVPVSAYSFPPAPQMSPEVALTKFKETIAYRQSLLERRPKPSDFGGEDRGPILARGGALMEESFRAKFGPLDEAGIDPAEEPYERYRSALVAWNAEMDAIDHYLTGASRMAIPAVTERGRLMAEKIDAALAERKPDDNIPTVSDKQRSSAEATKEVRTQLDNLQKAQKVLDGYSDWDGEKWVAVASTVRHRIYFIVPGTDLKQGRLSPRDREIFDSEVRTEEDRRAFYISAGKMTLEADSLSGGIHGYEAMPDEDVLEGSQRFPRSDALRQQLTDLHPASVIVTRGEYGRMLSNSARLKRMEIDRLHNKWKKEREQSEAEDMFSKGPTRVIRDVLAQEIPIGGDIATFNSGSKGAKAVAFHAELIPTRWIETSNQAGPLYVETARSRAHYQDESTFVQGDRTIFGSTLKISGNFTNDDVLHEMGHRIESTNPDVVYLERAFFSLRTADSESKTLRELFPGHGYGFNETSLPDDFSHGYMGKSYTPHAEWKWQGTGKLTYTPPSVDRPGMTSRAEDYRYASKEAYELLSMGLPAVYGRGPHTLKPEDRHFILGLMLEAGE